MNNSLLHNFLHFVKVVLDLILELRLFICLFPYFEMHSQHELYVQEAYVITFFALFYGDEQMNSLQTWF